MQLAIVVSRCSLVLNGTDMHLQDKHETTSNCRTCNLLVMSSDAATGAAVKVAINQSVWFFREFWARHSQFEEQGAKVSPTKTV